MSPNVSLPDANAKRAAASAARIVAPLLIVCAYLTMNIVAASPRALRNFAFGRTPFVTRNSSSQRTLPDAPKEKFFPCFNPTQAPSFVWVTGSA